MSGLFPDRNSERGNSDLSGFMKSPENWTNLSKKGEGVRSLFFLSSIHLLAGCYTKGFIKWQQPSPLLSVVPLARLPRPRRQVSYESTKAEFIIVLPLQFRSKMLLRGIYLDKREKRLVRFFPYSMSWLFPKCLTSLKWPSSQSSCPFLENIFAVHVVFCIVRILFVALTYVFSMEERYKYQMIFFTLG